MADITITAANVKLVTGTKAEETAGEAMSAGTWIYKDATSKKMFKADCTNASKDEVAGMTLTTADAADAPVVFAKDGAEIDVGSVVTKAESYILSEAGKMAPVADLASSDYLTQLCYGKDADTIVLAITNTTIQKA